MWLLTAHAVPKPNTLTTEAFDEAWVACWINFPVQDGAEQLAQFYLDREGWFITQFQEAHWVKPESYPPTNENYQYVQEAEKDGASFLIQPSFPTH